MSEHLINPKLFERIRDLVMQARHQLQRSVNATMVQTYWDIGRMIVEEEQAGESLAAYGQQQLKILSQRLTKELGKGFSTSNLKNMRQFYRFYPNRQAVPSELSWTHNCVLMRVENSQARDWYAKETIDQNWSSRALERQIGTRAFALKQRVSTRRVRSQR